MKKLILILSVTVLIFNSCSTDESNNDDGTSNDDSESQVDLFIGIWSHSRTFFEGVERSIGDCNRQSNFTVNSDGTFIQTVYYTASGGSCQLDFEDLGTWENLGDNTYRISYDSDEDGDIYTEDITIDIDNFSVLYDNPYIYIYTKS